MFENEYRKRINLVVEYIDANLGQALTLDDLADISGISKLHLHLFLRKLIISEWSKHQALPTCEPDTALNAMLPFWRVVNPAMPLYKKLDPAIQVFVRSKCEQEGISQT